MNYRIENLLAGIILVFMFPQWNHAQKMAPIITFERGSHNYGVFMESDGVATAKFEFKNSGESPLVINNVLKKCACTSPEYPKKPIMPGDSGVIKVGYNPKGRPGPFRTNIVVISNALNKNVELELTGVVRGKEYNELVSPLTINEKYQFNLGRVMANTNHIALAQVLYNQLDTGRLQIFNALSDELKVEIPNLPKHISVLVTPEILGAGKEGVIYFYYNPKLKKDWGFVFDRFQLSFNGKIDPQATITISANIIEDFAKLSEEELKNAPKIEFDNLYHSFDTIYQNTKVKHKYVFTNTGKSDLIIRKVKPSCGCTASHLGKDVIGPGEESYIIAEFNAGIRKGRQNKTINVVTNDPNQSVVLLKFNGVVVPKEK